MAGSIISTSLPTLDNLQFELRQHPRSHSHLRAATGSRMLTLFCFGVLGLSGSGGSEQRRDDDCGTAPDSDRGGDERRSCGVAGLGVVKCPDRCRRHDRNDDEQGGTPMSGTSPSRRSWSLQRLVRRLSDLVCGMARRAGDGEGSSGALRLDTAASHRESCPPPTAPAVGPSTDRRSRSKSAAPLRRSPATPGLPSPPTGASLARSCAHAGNRTGCPPAPGDDSEPAMLQQGRLTAQERARRTSHRRGALRCRESSGMN